MITDEEIYLYLEHHGVRGMHWGVRRARSPSKSSKKSTDKDTKEKVRTAAGVALIVAGGALYANALLGKRNIKMSTVKNTVVNSAKEARINHLIDSVSSTKVSQFKNVIDVTGVDITRPTVIRGALGAGR